MTSTKHPFEKNVVSSISTGVPLKIFQPSFSHSTKPIFLRFIVFFTIHLLKVSNGETETELLWGSWMDQPVAFFEAFGDRDFVPILSLLISTDINNSTPKNPTPFQFLSHMIFVYRIPAGHLFSVLCSERIFESEM